MDGHQAHFIAAFNLLPLDLDISAVEPVEESLQCWNMIAFKSERGCQQFVERVNGCVTEPREQFAPALHRARQYGFQKLIRRVEIRHRQQLHQRLDFFIQRSAATQKFPEALVCMVRSAIATFQQFILGPAQQRRHQQAGEIEIVIWLQDKADRRQQILHDKRLVQADAVNPGHGDFLGKQAGNDQRAEFIPLAHQYQNILGLQRPVLPVQPKRIVRRQPLLDLHRQLLGKDPFLLACPRFLILVFGGAIIGNRLPQRDAAAGTLIIAAMFGNPLIEPQLFVAKLFQRGIDYIQNRWCRTKTPVERHISERLFRSLRQTKELGSRIGVIMRAGALKTENRLLKIANREEGAVPLGVDAHAGKKLACQRAHDIPLR